MNKNMCEKSSSPLNERRDFLSKYGKLAALTPVCVTALVSPKTSAAPKSCRGNGAKSCNI